MRQRTFFFLVLLAIAFWSGHSYAFETRGQDCAKCHTLKNDEAANLFKEAIPNVKILEIGMSPTKGFWEIFLESGAKKNIIYLDFAKKHFFAGSLYSLKDRKNLTQERFSDLNKVDVSQIPLDDALVMGEKTAKYRAIVFDDPD